MAECGRPSAAADQAVVPALENPHTPPSRREASRAEPPSKSTSRWHQPNATRSAVRAEDFAVELGTISISMMITAPNIRGVSIASPVRRRRPQSEDDYAQCSPLPTDGKSSKTADAVARTYSLCGHRGQCILRGFLRIYPTRKVSALPPPARES